MASTAHLPRSGQGDPADFTNLEEARLSNFSVGDTTPVELGGSRKRTTILVQNQSVADLYIGFDNTVTNAGANRGLKLLAGSQVSFNFAETIPLFAVTSSGAQDITVVEAY